MGQRQVGGADPRGARPGGARVSTLDRLPTWVARGVWAIGLVSVLSALVPALRYRLAFVRELVPGFVPPVAVGATLAVGLTLMAVAGGLRRRKRHAWWLAVGLSSASVLLHLVKAFDVEEAGLSVAVLVALLLTRSRFAAAADPSSRRRALVPLLVAPPAAIAVGAGYLWLRRRQFGDAPWSDIIGHAAAGLVGLGGPLAFRDPAVGDRVAIVLGTLGVLALVVALAALLRPAQPAHDPNAALDPRLRSLIAAHGRRDSLAYFALRHDKSVVVSPSGKAAIAYRVVSGVSLASGDPVGDPEAWPGAIHAWLDQAEEHAWVPAVLGAGERAATVYARHGLDALELGDEAVLDLATFSLEGREMRAVRQAVNRVRRAGTTAIVGRTCELSPDAVEQIRRAASHWRGGETERGFSMALGRFGDPADPDCVLVQAIDADGQLCGLLHLVPWGADGLSLDLMRRPREGENGIVEFMVAELVDAGRSMGIARLSLNFALFRAALARGERIGAGPALRVWRATLLVASRFWQIESLYRSNAKFRPAWEPRFVCFGSARDLARITVAALRAEALITAPAWLGGDRTLR